MTLEEAMELEVDDELVSATEDAVKFMFGDDGQFTKPLREVALAAVDAVYRYHRKYYSREATKPKPIGSA